MSIEQVRRNRAKAMEKAQRLHPGKRLEWRNGQLVFSDTGQQVPDTPVIAKSTESERAPAELWTHRYHKGTSPQSGVRT
jgi:hypothetical protein